MSKLRLNRKLFAEALTAAAAAAGNNNPIPILNNVLLKWADKRIEITGTDLDLQVTTFCPCSIEDGEQFEVTAPARAIKTIVGNAGLNDEITLSSEDDKTLEIAGSDSQLSIHTLPAAEFPVVESFSCEVNFSIPSTELRRAFSLLRPSMGTLEDRQYLKGVCIYLNDDELTAVACDGHTLRQTRLAGVDEVAEFDGVIIPARTVGLMPSIMRESDQIATVKVGERATQFTTDTICIHSKNIDAKYPDFAKNFAKERDKVFKVSPSLFAEKCNLLKSVHREDRTTLSMTFDKSFAELSINDQKGGSGVSRIELQQTEGSDPLTIGANVSYMESVMSSIGADVCNVHLGDNRDPILVIPDNGDLFLVMAKTLSSAESK